MVERVACTFSVLILLTATIGPVGTTAKPEDPDGKGCCSRHGGVCGCSAGRAKCCDGNLSPTCGCIGEED